MPSAWASIVQLHSEIDPNAVQSLRAKAPKLVIMKSLIVYPQHTIDPQPLLRNAEQYQPLVDAFISDSFDSITGARDATGLTHDWKVSKLLSESLHRPLILAGGLNPDNVFEAIQEAQPSGVDAHTGVEDRSGAKSGALLKCFAQQAQRSFRHGGGHLTLMGVFVPNNQPRFVPSRRLIPHLFSYTKAFRHSRWAIE